MKIEQIESLLIEKLAALTTEQLIRFMVTGLRKRHTEIEMVSLGHIHGGVCFGCAATNAILEILEIPANVYISGKHRFNNSDVFILRALERFFDDLRRGYNISVYVDTDLATVNKVLGKEGHFQLIKYPEGLTLPYLANDYTEKDLQAYEKLADFQ